jgi:hypothetical protein
MAVLSSNPSGEQNHFHIFPSFIHKCFSLANFWIISYLPYFGTPKNLFAWLYNWKKKLWKNKQKRLCLSQGLNLGPLASKSITLTITPSRQLKKVSNKLVILQGHQ